MSSSSIRMLVGLATGALLGGACHALFADSAILEAVIRYLTEPIGQIFLRLLFMLVIPLIVSALVLGITELGDLRQLGRIGLKTLAYTTLVSGIAVVLGITLVNVVRPGEGLPDAIRDSLAARPSTLSAGNADGPSGMDFVVRLVPSNVPKAMAEGDMLAVMVFSVLLGVGLLLTKTEPAKTFGQALQGLYDVVMKLLALVLRMAPVGVACLLFTMTARLGYGILMQLGAYVGVVVGALLFQQFIVYGALVRGIGGMSPAFFFRTVRPAMVTAFSTASSNATLPTALQVAEEGLRLPRHVSRFVLTIGSTANQNGTALFEGVTVLFLAQFYGVDLSLAQQLTVVFVCILGGIGTAGVPAGSIPVVAMILGMVGIPVEGIGMIMGVDRFLDMCRTAVNVTGDLAVATMVSRGAEVKPPEPT